MRRILPPAGCCSKTRSIARLGSALGLLTVLSIAAVRGRQQKRWRKNLASLLSHNVDARLFRLCSRHNTPQFQRALRGILICLLRIIPTMLARRAYAVASAAAARAALALRHAYSPSVRGPQRQRPQAAHAPAAVAHWLWIARWRGAVPCARSHVVCRPHTLHPLRSPRQVRPAAAAAGLLSGHALLPAFTTLPASLAVRLGVRAPADGGVGRARASRVLHLGSLDHPRVSLVSLPVALSRCAGPLLHRVGLPACW